MSKETFHIAQKNFRKQPEAGDKLVSWAEKIIITVYDRVSNIYVGLLIML